MNRQRKKHQSIWTILTSSDLQIFFLFRTDYVVRPGHCFSQTNQNVHCQTHRMLSFNFFIITLQIHKKIFGIFWSICFLHAGMISF